MVKNNLTLRILISVLIIFSIGVISVEAWNMMSRRQALLNDGRNFSKTKLQKNQQKEIINQKEVKNKLAINIKKLRIFQCATDNIQNFKSDQKVTLEELLNNLELIKVTKELQDEHFIIYTTIRTILSGSDIKGCEVINNLLSNLSELLEKTI